MRLAMVGLALAGPAAAKAAAAGGQPAALPEGRLLAVAWSGNAHLPVAALEESTGWRAGRILDAGAWAALTEGVARAYGAVGRLTAGVQDVALSAGEGGLVARVAVAEGPQFRFGRVEVLGARSVGEDEVARLLDLPEGRPWSGALLESGIARVLDRYELVGRPFTQVRLRDVEIAGDRVEARILVVESDSVIVDSVIVDGPHRTRARVLGLALSGMRGGPYQRDVAEAARARLVDLGVFASVGEPRFELTGPGRGELHYDVVEAAANSFDGVFGYEGQSGAVSGLARLSLENIAGTARQGDLFWQGRGAGRTEFRLRYREPFLLGSRVAAGLAFTHELQDTQYTRTEYGLEGSLPLAEGTSLALGADGGRAVAAWGAVARTSWQGTHVALRRRSSRWVTALRSLPVAGYAATLTTSQRFTRNWLRPEGQRRGHLLTVGLDVEGERPVGGRRFLALGLEARFRDGDSRDLPVYDLFSIGGAASLRGYREEQFRASRYAIVRAEHGWGGSRARVFVFLDQGVFDRPAAGPLSTAERGTRYRAGYGFGASVPTSLGRVGVDLGWGQGDGPLDAKLHVRLRSLF